MGSGKFDSNTYRAYASSTVGKSTDQVFTQRHLHKDLDPKGVKVRESRDSTDNPKSTPIIVALDVTGSMGMLADAIAREGLGTLFNSILDRKPVTDPHVMFMAIGDARSDEYPLQVSQFEADNRIVQQLSQIYLEGNGGGNDSESYNFPWYFAGFRTVHDSFEKRGKRGYLFTVGDECAPDNLTCDQIEQFTGVRPEEEMTTKEMLEIAERFYDVYHIIIAQGSFASRSLPRVQSTWRELLGQHAITLTDYKKLAETIVSTIEVAEGNTPEAAMGAWADPNTAKIVYEATKHLTAGKGNPKLLGT